MLPKVPRRLSYALQELISDVCWDRIVYTSSEAASSRASHSTGPYSGPSFSITSAAVTEGAFLRLVRLLLNVIRLRVLLELSSLVAGEILT